MNKSLAVMQPYFFPYIGYFQLIKSVDEFVIYDNIKYTKKGWINRNKILGDGSAGYVSLPLKKDSDFLDVVERKIADSWEADRKKLINKIRSVYRKAPYFNQTNDLVQECLAFNDKNLFNFIYHSVKSVNHYLGIKSKIIVSSHVDVDHSLKSEDKVLSICKKQNATHYVNLIGGVDLYSRERFKCEKIILNFVRTNPIVYRQYGNGFIPNLSIIDVMMFNSLDEIKRLLNCYTLI